VLSVQDLIPSADEKSSNIGPPKLNAAKLGEAPTGPVMLQDHGMPAQFRNIWVVEAPSRK
jgi:hypothetical protein